MAETHEQAYHELCQRAREISLLQSIENLLEWDENVLLPPAGVDYRAEQMTYLAGQIHRQSTDAKFGELLDQLAESPLAAEPASAAGCVIRQLKKRYDRETKLPQRLVEELAKLKSVAQSAWAQARRNSHFPTFQPYLEQMVALKREEAAAVGFAEVAYDALLDDFEPDELTSQVAGVLAGLRDDLVPLVQRIANSSKQAPVSILSRTYPNQTQEFLGQQAAAAIGFDFRRGRLDVSVHPFCARVAPDDCRMTTRYNERFFNEAFFGVLHESGHGLYELGLPTGEHYGLPTGQPSSMGIHESQSRLWENFVGRSRAFWDHFWPQAQAAFPGALGDVTLDDFYFAINDVRPSLIRVEADEATYNLHILVRFELEQQIIAGELEVGDIQQAWNEKYQHYLGMTPPDDAQGCLQDVHWSFGGFGYFPSYALGNLYAAQFFAQADQDLGGLHDQFRRGEFRPLLDWLRENIHQHGQRYSAAELVQRVTGKPLSHQPLMDHLEAKFGPLYGV